MTSRKVHIVCSGFAYANMFIENGWEVVDSIEEADLVQFTGGADVDPRLYREERHPYTGICRDRDTSDIEAFSTAFMFGKPLAGICRGGQFLNVMCGGKMYQHVDNHAIGGTHAVKLTGTDKNESFSIQCTSTHHQMMRPGKGGEVLGTADLATRCEYMAGDEVDTVGQPHDADVEVVYYKNRNALCFQPHPEFMTKDSPCQQWYFRLIEEKLLS